MKLILAEDHTLFRNGLALLLKCELWEAANEPCWHALHERDPTPTADGLTSPSSA